MKRALGHACEGESGDKGEEVKETKKVNGK